MRPAPDPRVVCWLNGADAGILHVSTISIAEILYGLDLLPAGRRRAGRPMAAPDGQIAAIARSRAMALATRNIRDFEACGLALINPWA